MERLTTRDEHGTSIPNHNTIGEICNNFMSICDDYDLCEGCPIGKLIDQLCAYEDTGLTPEEIVQLREKKNTAKVRRCLEKGMKQYGIPKEVYIDVPARVTRRGILIEGEYYYSDKLFAYIGDRVDVKIYTHLHIAEVLCHRKHIETFDLLQ